MDMNIGFIRGTYADEWGNVVLTKEVSPFDATPLAQAVHNSGGIVVVQVEKIVKGGTLDPKLVKVPGIYVTTSFRSMMKRNGSSPSTANMTRP